MTHSEDEFGDGWTASPGREREALQLLSTPLHNRSPSVNLARRLTRNLTGNNTILDGEDSLNGSLLDGEDGVSASSTSSTFAQATFNGVNILAGAGTLSLPFAFRQTGWLLGSCMLAYLCATTNHTGKIIGRCMSMDKRIRTYGDLGYFAFGPNGKAFITWVFCIELVAALSMFLTIMGDNLHAILSKHGPSYFSRDELYVICTLVVLPTCWTSRLSLLSSLSVMGIFSSFFLLFCLIYTGFTVERGLEEGGSFYSLNLSDFVAVGSIKALPYSIGLQMVGFAGHAVFPSIYESLSEKERFSSLIDLVYMFTSALYLSMGLIGFLLFTDSTQEELTINLHNVAPDSYVVNIAMWLIIVNPFSKFALTLNPLATIVEGLVLGPVESIDITSRKRKALELLLRTGLALLSMSLAIFLPSFATICAFVGAFCSFIVSGIFPIMCYLSIFRHDLSPLNVLSNRVMLIFNVLLCVIGTAAVFFPPTS